MEMLLYHNRMTAHSIYREGNRITMDKKMKNIYMTQKNHPGLSLNILANFYCLKYMVNVFLALPIVYDCVI